MSENLIASTAVPSRGADQQATTGADFIRRTPFIDWVLQHSRILPTLLDAAPEVVRYDPREDYDPDDWETGMVALSDRPDNFQGESIKPEEVVDDDVQATLEAMIERVCRLMITRPPVHPEYDADHHETMIYDVALAYQGRILAVVRHSPHGPVVVRFNDESISSGSENQGASNPGLGVPGSPGMLRARWISTPLSRAFAAQHRPRAFAAQHGLPRQYLLRSWMNSVTALVQGTRYHLDSWIPDKEYKKGGLQGALDAAITIACEAMLTQSEDRCRGVNVPDPLERDVALASYGFIHAVVQYTPSGPIVTWFT
jgi:hypothetical protein